MHGGPSARQHPSPQPGRFRLAHSAGQARPYPDCLEGAAARSATWSCMFSMFVVWMSISSWIRWPSEWCSPWSLSCGEGVSGAGQTVGAAAALAAALVDQAPSRRAAGEGGGSTHPSCERLLLFETPRRGGSPVATSCWSRYDIGRAALRRGVSQRALASVCFPVLPLLQVK